MSISDGAFFGKGKSGPSIFFTDNSDELRDSLHVNWPDANLLLCQFHVLQQVWRWLTDKNHGIAATDRTSMYYIILILFIHFFFNLFMLTVKHNLEYDILCIYLNEFIDQGQQGFLKGSRERLLGGEGVWNKSKCNYCVVLLQND